MDYLCNHRPVSVAAEIGFFFFFLNNCILGTISGTRLRSMVIVPLRVDKLRLLTCCYHHQRYSKIEIAI